MSSCTPVTVCGTRSDAIKAAGLLLFLTSTEWLHLQEKHLQRSHWKGLQAIVRGDKQHDARARISNAAPLTPEDQVGPAGTGRLGAVLMHEGRPIAYYSYKVSAERSYPTGEEELWAVVNRFQNWRCYLEGCKGGATVVTDHKPNIPLPTKDVGSVVTKGCWGCGR